MDIMGTPLYESLDPATQRRIVRRLEELDKQRHRYQRLSTGEDLTTMPMLDVMYRNTRKRETKTQQKTREKRKRIIQLQYFEGAKPKDIAKLVGVTSKVVYNTTLLMRLKLDKMLKQLENGAVRPEDLIPTKRQCIRDDPLVQAAVRDYLQISGIHRLTLKKVKDHVVGMIPGLARIHTDEISHILRKQHYLRMERLNPATFRYRDPYYDTKRLWVSRLMT